MTFSLQNTFPLSEQVELELVDPSLVGHFNRQGVLLKRRVDFYRIFTFYPQVTPPPPVVFCLQGSCTSTKREGGKQKKGNGSPLKKGYSVYLSDSIF